MAVLDFFRINARWLAAGALLTFTSSFGQTYFISIFAGEIRGTFGLTDGQWGLIYTAGTMASAIVMVWAGVLTDRYRVRALGAVVLAALAAACLFMATVNAAWALPIVVFALRFTGQGMTSHIAVVAMARWFVAARGRALAVAGMGFSLGEALMPMIFVALLSLVSWRSLWLGAAVFAVLVIPVLLGLLREERTPASVAEDNQSFGLGGRFWTRKDVIRHWFFWLVFPAILSPGAFVTALFFHQVHLAEVRGWSHLGFVALFPFYTGAGVVSMIAAGWAIDRFGVRRLAPFYLLPFAAGFALLGMAETLWPVAFAMAVIGIGGGINSTVPAALLAELYGTRHLGAIKALATAVMVLGSAVGPGITGLFIDAGADFPAQAFAIGLWFLVIAAVMATGLRRLG